MTKLVITLVATFALGWASHALFEDICDEIRIRKLENKTK